MTTRLKLYNHALRLCGHSRLASLSDGVEARHLLDDAWDDDFIWKVLESGLWNFAMRAQALTPETSVDPPFGYNNAFLKGSDWVRTAAVCDDEYFRSPLLDYQDETSYIFAELQEIWVRFVSNDSAYGSDLSKWPGSFQNYAAGYLAGEIIHKLTSDKERVAFLHGTDGRGGYIESMLREARSQDAMEDPTRFLPTGTWVSSRGRGRRRGPFGDRGVTGSLTG
jgi:hypothetical protein